VSLACAAAVTLCTYVIFVCRYYPLYPPHPEVPIDMEQFDNYCRLPVTPNLFVLPSDLRCFVKVTDYELWICYLMLMQCILSMSSFFMPACLYPILAIVRPSDEHS
jgi:hypothetical protein